MIGIPLVVVGLCLATYQFLRSLHEPAYWEFWWRPVLMVVGGYFLQLIGHWHEGNDLGEMILVKKVLGLPYTAVSPRYAQKPHAEPAPPQSPARAPAESSA